MATEEERLRIVVEAQDKASAIIQNVGRSAAKAVNDIRAAFSDLSTASGGMFGAYMIRQAAEYQIELAKIAAGAERVRASFRGLAGENAAQTFEQLRTASRGTIDDVNLMLAANKAMMLGVSQSGDELSRLMVVAIERGKAMGISAQDAFGDIVTGIGRMSPLILDNLGIVTGGQRAFEEYAASLGKTADELTDVERKQMLVNKVLESASPAAREAGASPLDAAAQFEKLDAQVSNLKANLGGLLAGITVGPIVAVVAKEAEVANTAFDKMRGHHETLSGLRAEVQANADALGPWNTALLTAYTYINELSAGAAMAEGGTENLTDAAKRQMAQMMGNEAITRSMAGRYMELEGAARGAADGVRELTKAELARAIAAGRQAGYGIIGGAVPGQAGALRSQAASDALDIYLQRQEENAKKLERAIQLGNEAGAGAIGAAMGGTEAARASQAAADQVAVTLAEAEALAKVGDAQFAYQLSTRDASGQIELWTQKLGEAEEGSVEYYQILTRIQGLQNSMAKGGAKAIAADARELRSLAESLLQPTNVSALDMAQTKLGTYTDKWDEYARRVRAAGNDVKSEWRNLVPLDILAQGEDAIKAWAAAEEEAFYAGQRPDQMNWDAYIENARREVEKQLARENLVNEAMARLAAAGIGGLSRADVAKQFGVADTATVGTDMAQQTVTGMTTVDAGKQFTEAFNTQFRAQEARWMEFGSLSVTWFGVGVQNGVASGAADTLVNALVPRIQEKLQGRP